MLPKQLQDSIEKLPKEQQVLFQAIVDFFEQKLAEKEARIKKLEDQISKNSKNSSKPPSTDGYNKPSPKSQRKKSGLKPGGQKGHKGGTLKMVEKPDETIPHKVERCECCQKDLSDQKVDDVERRQVYDIPPLNIIVTEHQAEVKICSCGQVNKAAFPEGVDRYVQYGPRLKGTLVYLQDYQLLPFERTKELVQDLFNHKISTGTLYNTREHAFNRLSVFEQQLIQLLIDSSVAGFDETGFRVMAQRLWLHSCSTDAYTYYAVHKKRGSEAMDDIGILPDFKGVAIHDFWKSYFKYKCEHGLCNAHLLRDLTFIKERFEQSWPDDMAELLVKMKDAKDKAVLQGKSAFSKTTLNKYRKQYDAIVEQGFKANPFEPPAKKKRGRVAKPPPLNLLERLSNYADDFLRFFYDFKVPFDNNFSERDIRMMKVKQKISGCFRSMKGAINFARIRSYIVTARKQKVNIFDALTNLFMDNSVAANLTGTR